MRTLPESPHREGQARRQATGRRTFGFVLGSSAPTPGKAPRPTGDLGTGRRRPREEEEVEENADEAPGPGDSHEPPSPVTRQIDLLFKRRNYYLRSWRQKLHCRTA